MNRKVTVVGGAGNVGATVARSIAEKELADVVIIDIADQKAAGVKSHGPSIGRRREKPRAGATIAPDPERISPSPGSSGP